VAKNKHSDFWRKRVLLSEIKYEFDPENKDWFATCEPVLAFGIGRKKKIAKAMFLRMFADRYIAFSESETLGPFLKRELEYMNGMVKVKES
jgi:hypothetical protein